VVALDGGTAVPGGGGLGEHESTIGKGCAKPGCEEPVSYHPEAAGNPADRGERSHAPTG
jgi:hypothetical protein